MTYKERQQDLFTVDDSYHLVHCISADFGMGRDKLQTCYSGYLDEFIRNNYKSACLMMGHVFNLITKERYWQKPTYETMRGALEQMKKLAVGNGVKRIAMPIIGCGLDRLDWDKVSTIIQEVFSDTDIEILVCKQ